MQPDPNEINDQTWNALIILAMKYHDRIGNFHSERFDRMSVYTVKGIVLLAPILVESGMIKSWPAGFRRLHSLEAGAMARFKKVHRKIHTDP